MDRAEERIIEEVRKYDNLYNFSSKNYKDCKMTMNSWREIAQNTGLEVTECMRRWKNLRDKYVRLRRTLATQSGAPGGQRVPAFYPLMSWLAPHVKHRETDSKTLCGSSASPAPPEPPRSVTTPSRPPASSPGPRPKRKRDQQDDLFAEQMANLDDRRMEVQQKLLQEEDECSRFGQTVGDLLRRVPEDQRPDLMFKVYGLIHGNSR